VVDEWCWAEFFFSSLLHLFFIDKIYTQFFSNLLIFVVKVNLV